MFRKSLRILWSIALPGALGLSTISISGQRMVTKSKDVTASSKSSPQLSTSNSRFDVPLRGHRLVLHCYLPANVVANAPLVIYNSGSGGWHDFDQYLATTFAERGLPVFGVSTHSYLKDFYDDEHPATFATVAEDYLELIKQARKIAKIDESRPVILAGWSLGAGYAPLVASDPRIKPEVLGVIALSLSRDNETALTVSHRLMSRLMGRTYGPSFDVSQYLARVAPVPVAIIQAARDRNASPGKAQQLIDGVGLVESSTLRLFQVTAGRTHSFAGGRAEVDQTLDEVITWFRTAGRRS
jgi:dienelactone hydrolase